MVSPFTLGQRWVSNTEPDLGLGVVTNIDGRHINLHFPAAGEDRTYATNNCPLSRVIYRVGESVSDHEQKAYTVVAVDDMDGFLSYDVTTEDGEEKALPESMLNSLAIQYAGRALTSGSDRQIKPF